MNVKDELPAELPPTYVEDVNDVYDRLGGMEGLYEWAASSPDRLDKFYQWFLSKRLPNEVTGEAGGPILIQLKNV